MQLWILPSHLNHAMDICRRCRTNQDTLAQIKCKKLPGCLFSKWPNRKNQQKCWGKSCQSSPKHCPRAKHSQNPTPHQTLPATSARDALANTALIFKVECPCVSTLRLTIRLMYLKKKYPEDGIPEERKKNAASENPMSSQTNQESVKSHPPMEKIEG